MDFLTLQKITAKYHCSVVVRLYSTETIRCTDHLLVCHTYDIKKKVKVLTRFTFLYRLTGLTPLRLHCSRRVSLYDWLTVIRYYYIT